jgi:hypothetical protein
MSKKGAILVLSTPPSAEMGRKEGGREGRRDVK